VAAQPPLDRGGRRQQLLERREAAQQPRGGLGPDPGHARDVVAAIADQRQIVGQLFGADSELRRDRRGVDLAAPEMVPHLHAGRQELGEDLVGRQDDHRGAGRRRLDGHRGDDVVGFEGREVEGGDADLAERLAVGVERLAQGRRHRGVPLLVARIELVPPASAGAVEDTGGVRRRALAQGPPQRLHRRHACRLRPLWAVLAGLRGIDPPDQVQRVHQQQSDCRLFHVAFESSQIGADCTARAASGSACGLGRRTRSPPHVLQCADALRR
jgi:hypothetical protein